MSVPSYRCWITWTACNSSQVGLEAESKCHVLVLFLYLVFPLLCASDGDRLHHVPLWRHSTVVVTRRVLFPAEIEDLSPATQEQLFSELLDGDAQKELEEADVDSGRDGASSGGGSNCVGVINWSDDLKNRLRSGLSALWNRSAGDCLLDSVLQATWGVFDRDNTLRRAMADSLHEASHV